MLLNTKQDITAFTDLVQEHMGSDQSCVLTLDQDIIDSLKIMSNRMTVIGNGLLYRIDGNTAVFARAVPYRE